MKKLLILCLSVVLVFACVTLTACDDCTFGHEWGEWEETKPLTCVAQGEQTRTCAVCGEQEMQLFGEVAGHKPTEIPAKAATCTESSYTAGSVCSVCNTVLQEPQVGAQGALGHQFDESKLNYFTYTECSNGCGTYKVLESKNIYADDFVYDFDADKKAEIDGLYNQLIALLDGTAAEISGEEFDKKFEEYDDFVTYVQFQYQVGQVLNDYYATPATQQAYSTINEYYYETVANYYGLFQLIYDSPVYSTYFYQGWTPAEIAEVLELAESYDAESRTEAEKIKEEYNQWMASHRDGLYKASITDRNALYDIYKRLVTANNNIATKAGYDNYMDYAYANVYDRDYTPADVANMREYVRTYIGPLASQIQKESEAYKSVKLNDASQWFFNTYNKSYVFRDLADVGANANRINAVINSRQSLHDYYTFLSENANSQHTSFSKALSDLFENGNYFLGESSEVTAYAWYIYDLDLPILLFSEDYRSSFTFVHEFGHYYQFIYNGKLGVSMDHDETQSQGDEMLYLAYLKEHMPAGVEDGFKGLELAQLEDMLLYTVVATAVDEFEYLVYSGATTYNGSPIAGTKVEGGAVVTDYTKLFQTVMNSYCEGISQYYWSYVVFNSPAYYISYAMSALPSVEIYAKAGIEGLEAARDSYLKLFTFSDEEQFVETEVTYDEEGTAHYTKSIKEGVTYQSILNWADLNGPFQEDLYKTIKQFFDARNQ